MSEKNLVPAPLDEKNVVTDFIECDILAEGCAHRQEGRRHVYVGFYEGCPLLVEYWHGDNYLRCRFVGDDYRGKTLRLEQMLTAGNDDPATNVCVTSQRTVNSLLLRFWFKPE